MLRSSLKQWHSVKSNRIVKYKITKSTTDNRQKKNLRDIDLTRLCFFQRTANAKIYKNTKIVQHRPHAPLTYWSLFLPKKFKNTIINRVIYLK